MSGPTSSQHDRGLHAVARVRGIREQDSRLGLQQALAEEAAHRSRLAALQQLQRVPGTTEGSLGQFVAERRALELLGRTMGEVRQELATAHTITEEARGRWQHEKTRLSAVESLLEHRAIERAAAERRSEDRRQDEVAGQLWLRQRQETER